MADTEITWRGLVLGGDTDYIINEMSGWESLPDTTDYDTPRSRGHGDHIGDQYARARIVTVSGKIANSPARDGLAMALQNASPVSSTVQDLRVEMLGRTLTAGARIIQRSLTIGMSYSVGEIPFALQWKCPDPLRYGAVQALSTGLPVSSGGLAYPLAYPLDYGTAGTRGQITLSNAGTADTPVVFTVTGSLPSGFEISASTGQRLTYPTPVAAGAIVVIDTGEGTVLAEGTADRRADMTVADWIQVPAGGSVTVQFTSLGGAYDAGATLAASWRSASW